MFKKVGASLGGDLASEAASAGMGEIAGAAGIEVPEAIDGAVSDAVGGAVEDRIGGGAQAPQQPGQQPAQKPAQNPSGGAFSMKSMGNALGNAAKDQAIGAAQGQVEDALGDNPMAAQMASGAIGAGGDQIPGFGAQEAPQVPEMSMGGAAGLMGKMPGFGKSAPSMPSMAMDATEKAALNQGKKEQMVFNYQQPGKKATTILSPHLETLPTGSMLIVLDGNNVSHQIGKPLTGKILVSLQEDFEAKGVSLKLCGFHRSHFQPEGQAQNFGSSNVQTDGMTRLAKTLLSVNFEVANFGEGRNLKGQSEFRFQMQMPDAIKESVMLQFENNNLSETYYLQAQVDPVNNAFYANQTEKVSMLRTDLALYLYSNGEQEEQKLGNPSGNSATNLSLSQKLEIEVGGIAGLGSSQAKAMISLDKKTFKPGESIRVNFDMDNSDCKKPVKSYKIKLMRRVTCFSGKKARPLLTKEEYLVALKYDGCNAKVKDKRTIEFQLPMADKQYGTVDNLHPELRQLVKMFSSSVDNSLFLIEYVLDIFVKHQSKLEFGMGNSVSFPIQVNQEETNLSVVTQDKENLWREANNAQNWSPSLVNPTAVLTHRKEADGTYTPFTEYSQDGHQAEEVKSEPVAEYNAYAEGESARQRALEEQAAAEAEAARQAELARLQQEEEDRRIAREREEHDAEAERRYQEEMAAVHAERERLAAEEERKRLEEEAARNAAAVQQAAEDGGQGFAYNNEEYRDYY